MALTIAIARLLATGCTRICGPSFLGISVGLLVPCRDVGFKRNEAKGRIAPHKNVKLGSRLPQWREQTTTSGLVEASFRGALKTRAPGMTGIPTPPCRFSSPLRSGAHY